MCKWGGGGSEFNRHRGDNTRCRKSPDIPSAWPARSLMTCVTMSKPLHGAPLSSSLRETTRPYPSGWCTDSVKSLPGRAEHKAWLQWLLPIAGSHEDCIALKVKDRASDLKCGGHSRGLVSHMARGGELRNGFARKNSECIHSSSMSKRSPLGSPSCCQCGL